MINEETNEELDTTIDTTVDASEEAVELETEETEETEEVKPESPTDSNNNSLVDYLHSDILSIKKVKLEDLDSNVAGEEETDFDYDLNLFPNISQNQITRGTTVSVSDKDVCIDIGFKTEGMIPLSEFSEIPDVGDQFDVVVITLEDRRGNLILSKEKADFITRWSEIKTAYNDGEIIKGTIIKRIKGGMVVDIGVIQAFLPGSQIDIKPVIDFNDYIGKEFEFKIVKLNEMRKNVVLSRKEILAEDLFEKRQHILNDMEVGMVLEGMVKNITDFGAFIDLGGIDGLLHITDITWGRINHPSEKLSIGDTVTVKVIDFDVKKIRVSLGMKQLKDEPWVDIDKKYPVGETVEGKVVNFMNYGIFIELEEGVEGLIHISEISWTEHIKHPSDVFEIGDSISAKILSVESKDKKISLGIKQLEENPWDNIEEKYKLDSVHKGTVKNLTQFGAFVGLDNGVDGLIHISDFSWTKIIKHPKDMISEGEEIEVKVLEVSSADKKLSLGIKQLEEDPWDSLRDKYPSGDKVTAKVVALVDKGIVFDVDNTVEGILLYSKLSNEKIDSLKENYKIDNEYEMVVQSLDQEIKKIIFIYEESDEVAKDSKNEESDLGTIKEDAEVVEDSKNEESNSGTSEDESSESN